MAQLLHPFSVGKCGARLAASLTIGKKEGKKVKAKLIAMLLPLFLAFAFAARTQTGQMQGTSSQERSQKAKFTGCLQSGTTPESFTLNNVKVAQTRTGKTPSRMARAESSYTLLPDSRVNLARHVGHEVEITGSLMNAPTSSSGKSDQGQNAEIRVSSIRHISDTCR